MQSLLDLLIELIPPKMDVPSEQGSAVLEDVDIEILQSDKIFTLGYIPTEAQISNCINIQEFWPKTWSGISDYRVIGFTIFSLLIIIWVILEMVA